MADKGGKSQSHTAAGQNPDPGTDVGLLSKCQ